MVKSKKPVGDSRKSRASEFSVKSSEYDSQSNSVSMSMSRESLRIDSRSAKKSSSGASISGKSGKKKPPTVRLIHRKGQRHVSVAKFVAVSEIMRQRHSEGRLAKQIELSDYSKESVELFAVYIETGTLRKVQLSYLALAELLKLSKAFSIELLQIKLEEQLIMAVSQTAETVLEGLLVAGITPVSRETESQLQYLAAWRFTELARSSSFRKIPLHQFIMLLGSCELNVSHELVVADAALVWLVGQKQPRNCAASVFSMIRASYLSKVDKQLIFERISGLGLHESISRTAWVALSARHNERVCLEKAHLSRHLPRCGIEEGNDGRKSHEPAMPLSRPRPEIKYAGDASEGKVRPKKSVKSSKRSGVSSSSKDKSGKSKKSSRSKVAATSKVPFMSKMFPKSKKSSKGGSSESTEKSESSGKRLMNKMGKKKKGKRGGGDLSIISDKNSTPVNSERSDKSIAEKK